MDIEVANKLAEFFFILIQSRSGEISRVDYHEQDIP